MGMLKNVELQLADNLACRVVAAVIDSPENYMLIGQDLFGGNNSKYKLVNYNCDYSFMTVVDEKSG